MTPGLVASLAATAEANLTTAYPYAPAHVVGGEDDRALPRELHPAFWGAYDWHSCVHMSWLLAHLVLRHGAAGRDRLDATLLPDALQVEADYLRAHPGFERPYGWAWLLLLAAECREEPAWSSALAPCVDALQELLLAWLPRARPVRTGTHDDTAFALGLVLEACGPLASPRSPAPCGSGHCAGTAATATPRRAGSPRARTSTRPPCPRPTWCGGCCRRPPSRPG